MLKFACKKFNMSEIIQCSLGISKAECRLFEFLLYEEGNFTAQEIAKKMKLDRTTVQKSIKTLVKNDIVVRKQKNLDKGGYIFSYEIKDKNVLRNKIKNIVSEWSTRVLEKIDKW